MISFPEIWERIGQPINLKEIKQRLCQVIRNINVHNLSLSGGVDSSYLLHCMVEVFGKDVACFTIALSSGHPDYIYSKQIAEYFNVKWYPFSPRYVPTRIAADYPGDEIVRAFYENLHTYKVDKIIAGDGIDEFLAGYYKHDLYRDERIYYEFLEKLFDTQLEPLNRNSGPVKVYLPYLDEQLITLYSQIPLREKYRERKAVMIELARDHIPREILTRRKYGFLDALVIKK